MRRYRVSIKGYCKGAKENTYSIEGSNLSVAVSRALKLFAKDFPRIRYDEVNIKVVL